MDHFADWTFWSRRPASALWMTLARSFGSEGGERTRGAVMVLEVNLAYHFK